jgi:uncharacterized protein (TIGR01777 family)
VSTILLAGASGFLGSHLARALAADGHDVVGLSRRPRATDVGWDPERGMLDRDALARVAPHIVINLAGAPIAQRWTSVGRRRIRESRVVGTHALAAAVAALSPRPTLMIGASAIGYYGADRGDEVLDESSTPGDDYLGRLGVEWEAAVMPARDAGIRTVLTRTGVVLHRSGGMLARTLLPFRLGLGGRLGNGRQWMSWISLADWVGAVRTVMASDTIAGPVNLVAPEPVRNAEFTRAMGDVLRRPVIFPLPAFLLRLVFGAMADGTLLASQRVVPKRLAGAGFEFRHPRIHSALEAAIRR